MLEKVEALCEAVVEAAEAYRRVGLPNLKADIPNEYLDLFKGCIYAEHPEYEIRFEIPAKDPTRRTTEP